MTSAHFWHSFALTPSCTRPAENGTLETVFQTPGGQVEITSLHVLIKEIVFDAEGPAGSISRTIPGTFDVDVLTLESTPEYPLITLGPGRYTTPNFGVEVDDVFPGRDAIEMEGVFSGNMGDTRFVYTFNSGEVFELSLAAMTVEEGMILDAGRMFHPSRWFPSVDLNNATLTNGTIEISRSSNIALFNQMADALDRSTQEGFTDGTFGI